MKAPMLRCMVVVCVLLGPSIVAAQDEGDQRARELFASAEEAYGEGRFPEALALFEEAYELSDRPQLLYNIGLAATNAGDERTALTALEHYLDALPDAENRGIVEGRIANLRRELAEEGAAEEERARRAEEDASRAQAGAEATRSAGWAMLVSGGGLAIGGIATLTAGFLDIASVEGAAMDTPWANLRGAYERAPILTGVGYGALGIGCVLLGAGLAVALGTPDPQAALAVRVGPTSLTLEGAF